MKARCDLCILKQLIHDTFRQACASGICWMMLAVTAICVVLCLSVSVSGDVSLQDDNEPVLFLPPPSPRAVTSAAAASQKVAASPRNRSRAGSSRGSRDDQRPHDPGLWCRFDSR